MGDFVKIVEVGPRDGLQNEVQAIAVATKISLIERLSACGFREVEAGAFVSPKWVPQMAGSAEVLAGIKKKPGIAYPVLVPNEKGYKAAREAGAERIAVFGAASESFSRKNINASIEESLARFGPVVEQAKSDGVSVRGYVSCVLGCPYEGDIALTQVMRVSQKLFDMGCDEVSLGDTIGVGTPDKARAMLKAVAASIPMENLACHFHDTYGQALANLYACLEEGVRVIDASVAGLGGCPYAKGASGNVASEDVVYMLNGLKVKTGIDLDALIETAWWISEALGRAPNSKLAHALK
jgi:hydroxymethylglutaryl-CoA lyase